MVKLKLKDKIHHYGNVYSLVFEGVKKAFYGHVTLNLACLTKTFTGLQKSQEQGLVITTRWSDSAFKAALFESPLKTTFDCELSPVTLDLSRQGRPLLMVSHGVGLAGLMPLMDRFMADKQGIPKLVQITLDSGGHLYEDLFESWALDEDFESVYTGKRSSFWAALDSKVQHLMGTYGLDPLIYIVGSSAFLGAVKAYLLDMGMGPEDLVIQAPTYRTLCGCPPQGGCGCGANLIRVE